MATDCVAGLDGTSNQTPGVERGLIARPQYAKFQPISDMLLAKIHQLKATVGVTLVTHSINNAKRVTEVGTVY